MATYSLASYTLAFSELEPGTTLTNYSVGGSGSMMDSITISRPTEVYTTEGDPTGGYVHNKSLNKTGTVSLTLNQLSKQISTLTTLLGIYTNADVEKGFNMTLRDSQGNDVARCIDCLPQGYPEQVYGNTATTQTWVITCGEIDFLM